MIRKNILIVGSEGLIGKYLISNLQKKYNCIGIDIKKKKNIKNYFCCNLNDRKKFKKLLLKIHKRNKIFAAINLIYPLKSSTFLQENISKFTKFINNHIIAYYNFNKCLYDLLKKEKKRKIIINFSSVYGTKIPNFNIYKGTNIKMPIEYSISKSALIIMTKYFREWSKYKNKRIEFFSISPAGIESDQSVKFKKNYLKFYKKKMIPLKLIYISINKLLSNYKKKSKDLVITGGAKI